MEPQDNKQLALLKAINAHEQAAASLTDLIQGLAGESHRTMLERIEQNLAELRRETAVTRPADHV